MKISTILTLFIFFLLTVGCSIYKARNDGFSKIGYEEKQLDSGSYQLTYYGATTDSHKNVEKLWHKRAKELCSGEKYESATNKENWAFDSYTVLPPLFFKNKAAGPSIEGKLRCNS